MNHVSNLPRIWTRSFYPSLNGLRGLAAIMVVFCHLGRFLAPKLNWTALFWGNDLFFALSGFLVTGILYDTRNEVHYLSNFFKRRVLRIFPLYYGFFFLLMIATLLFPLVWHVDLLSFLVFLGNMVTPFAANNPTTINLIRHGKLQLFLNIGPLWSLCVEEQFYLVWPLIILLVRTRKKLLLLCAIMIPSTLLLRIILAATMSRSTSILAVYWTTYSRWDALLVGTWLSLWLRAKPLSRAQLRNLGATACVGGALLLMVPLHFDVNKVRLDNHIMQTVGLSATALMSLGLLILSLDENSTFSRCLRWSWLVSVGQVSYGIYFFHALVAPALDILAAKYKGTGPLFFALDVAGTFAAAKLSYRFWESPFLRLKDRWAPQQLGTNLHVPQPQPVAQVTGLLGV